MLTNIRGKDEYSIRARGWTKSAGVTPAKPGVGGGNRAAKASLQKKIKRFQKKAKLAKRKKHVAKAQRFKRELSALKKLLRHP
ncbi:MAG: hypothetical protein P1U87_09230 [Verrucomicrobiales bacterium]|nr:hypothetical protein [Verrucomicrobiales bacterium]